MENFIIAQDNVRWEGETRSEDTRGGSLHVAWEAAQLVAPKRTREQRSMLKR
jgi:hypothetical protein